MSGFYEYVLNEAQDVTISVAVDMTQQEKKKFTLDASKEKLTVVFGNKVKFAETASVTGQKNKVVKFLKSKGYTQEEFIQ